jgi:hypothetical protein
MSLTLTDGELPNQSATVLYDGDPTALSKAEWQEWNIDMRDFTGVNTALTNNIAIGLAGSGVMYLDDIRVYTGRCVPSKGQPAADLNDDCVVDEKDLDVIADSWGVITPTYTVTGNGGDIWGNADAFHYMFQELTGDGTMIARVTDNGSGTNEWAKGGVMIRQSLDAGSIHRYMPITAGGGNGASFQGRPVANEGSNNSDSGSAVAPKYWVKLERVGNDLSGFISPDGVTWTQLGGVETYEMEDPVLIGLAVTSHESSAIRTFTFDNVSIDGNMELELTNADIGDTLEGSGESAMIPSPADLNGDDIVDFDDVFTLLDSWLEEQLWPY